MFNVKKFAYVPMLKYTSFSIITFIILVFSFQNCSPTKFKESAIDQMSLAENAVQPPSCPSQVVDCKTDRGTGVETCQDVGGLPVYEGICRMQECLPPYMLVENQCIQACSPEGSTRACPGTIINGTGTEKCMNSEWSSCQVLCNDGFYLNKFNLCQANFIRITGNNVKAITPVGSSVVNIIQISYSPNLTYNEATSTTIEAIGGSCAAIGSWAGGINQIKNWRKNNIPTSDSYFSAYKDGSLMTTNNWSIRDDMIGCVWSACAKVNLGTKEYKDCINITPIVPTCGPDQFFDPTISQCKSCGPGQIPNATKTACQACTGNDYESSAGVCTACPVGSTPNADRSACVGTTYSCTGTPPTNATICSNPDERTGLTAITAITAVGNCTSAKCEYLCNNDYFDAGSSCQKCGPGQIPNAGKTACQACTGNDYESSAGVCTACPAGSAPNADRSACVGTTYSCTGTPPTNATVCSNPDERTGLTTNTAITAVGSCTSAKCEYLCNNDYFDAGSSCQKCGPGQIPNAGKTACQACTGNDYESSVGVCTACPAGSAPNADRSACLETNCSFKFSVNNTTAASEIETSAEKEITIHYSSNNSTSNTWSCDNGAKGENLGDGMKFNAFANNAVCTVVPKNSLGLPGQTCSATLKIIPAAVVCMGSCGGKWPTPVGGWIDTNTIGDIAYDAACSGSLAERGKDSRTALVCSSATSNLSQIRVCGSSCGGDWPITVGGWSDSNDVGDKVYASACSGSLSDLAANVHQHSLICASNTPNPPIVMCADFCGGLWPKQVGGWVDTNAVGDYTYGAGCSGSLNWGNPTKAVMCSQ